MSFHPFSADLWDYLEDLSYMPSRADRDALVASGDERRIQIWDYFFQVRPEDVGKPQRAEIQAVRADLEAEFQAFQQTVEQLASKLRSAEQRLRADFRRHLVIGLALLLAGVLLAAGLMRASQPAGRILFCTGVLGLPGAFLLARAGWEALSLSRARGEKEAKVADLKAIQERQVRAARSRIKTLELQIETLKQQIPTPPHGSQMREWLNAALAELHQRSIEQTGLRSRLVSVEEFSSIGDLMLYQNPIPVMGPGELQDEQLIPRNFARQVSPDLNKHLSARRAYFLADERSVDVLYGVYFIKFIAVTEDMLATYSLFYDFITGKRSGESVTEQYYRDVVAITTTRETRHIMLGLDSEEYILVEDAPTFTIYLAGTEERTVTFVNEHYFYEIRNKLGLEATQVPFIYWVGNADQVARDTVQLLRHYLRERKGEDYSEG
jgi:hypothetical protein